ncbi:MAG: radical SAM protein [Peptostreptococcaceae bacterium]|jgi:hypothetical protein|nr:radical SAM protein [Peptostreptococcaceae bacterium]
MKWTSFLRTVLSRNFKPFLFKGEIKKLEFEKLKNLGLYIHIPFCKKLCSFCPYQKVLYEKELAKNYKDALIKEIKLVGESLETKKEIESLYFGGGTPSLLIDYIKEILDTLDLYFDIKNGIGIELHPNDVDEDLVKKIKELNINMISLGIQSFDTGVLNVLGRKNINYLFWACYSMYISKKDFKYLIGSDLDDMFYLELKICEILKLIKKIDGGYVLTNKGAYYYHYIEQAYTTQYIDKMWNISRNVAFPDKIKLS